MYAPDDPVVRLLREIQSDIRETYRKLAEFDEVGNGLVGLRSELKAWCENLATNLQGSEKRVTDQLVALRRLVDQNRFELVASIENAEKSRHK